MLEIGKLKDTKLTIEVERPLFIGLAKNLVISGYDWKIIIPSQGVKALLDIELDERLKRKKKVST